MTFPNSSFTILIQVGSCESLLQVVSELVHELEGLEIVLALDGTHRALDANRQIFGHETRLDCVDADLLECFSELGESGVVVQGSAVQ